jgi:hypothetical protein
MPATEPVAHRTLAAGIVLTAEPVAHRTLAAGVVLTAEAMAHRALAAGEVLLSVDIVLAGHRHHLRVPVENLGGVADVSPHFSSRRVWSLADHCNGNHQQVLLRFRLETPRCISDAQVPS